MCLLGVALLAGCASSPEKTGASKDIQANAAPPGVTSDAQAKFAQAVEAMRTGDKASAERLLNELIQSYPELSGPYVNLGLLRFHDGKYSEAEEAFKKAVQLNPNSAVSYNHLGIISRGKGDFKEARGYYEKSLAISDDYAYAHLNMGILLDLYLGDLDLALKHYERYQALSTEPDKEVEKWIADLKQRIKKAKP